MLLGSFIFQWLPTVSNMAAGGNHVQLFERANLQALNVDQFDADIVTRF